MRISDLRFENPVNYDSAQTGEQNDYFDGVFENPVNYDSAQTYSR